MINENEQTSFGAEESEYDYRTISHDTLAGPVSKGGYPYYAKDITHQHKVGICTAIALTQNIAKATGVNYSPDFLYLLQKKYINKNWCEGSSIFSSLKAAQKYGLLKTSLFTYVTEKDRSLSYSEYITKLQAIPDDEIRRLITKSDRIVKGYARVDVNSPESIARAVDSSKSGILSRYVIDSHWYKPSWKPEDINPLQAPTTKGGGHAVTTCMYDYTTVNKQTLANTWSARWNMEGCGDIIYDDYRMTEAWIPYYDFMPEHISLPSASEYKHTFKKTLQKSQFYNAEVKKLQIALMILHYLPMIKANEMGYYGPMTARAVLEFQITYTKLSWYERYIMKGRTVGPKTRAALNKLFA